jgi:hypothetical protein
MYIFIMSYQYELFQLTNASSLVFLRNGQVGDDHMFRHASKISQPGQGIHLSKLEFWSAFPGTKVQSLSAAYEYIQGLRSVYVCDEAS